MQNNKLTNHDILMKIIVIMPVLFITINWLCKIKYDPTITLGEIIAIILTVIGGLWLIVSIITKLYVSKHPFKMAEAYENYDYYKSKKARNLSPWSEPIQIRCINGQWCKDRINIHLKARRKVDLKQINFRFVEKRILGTPQDVSTELIMIEKISSPQEKYYTKMGCYDDKKGGMDGVFDPPFSLSKNGILFLEIYPKLNIKTKWTGYISLENASGEEKRTFSRKKVIITNDII